jgi:hypothetical protein
MQGVDLFVPGLATYRVAFGNAAGEAPLSRKEWLAAMLEIVYTALTRNYPDLAVVDFVKSLGAHEQDAVYTACRLVIEQCFPAARPEDAAAPSPKA